MRIGLKHPEQPALPCTKAEPCPVDFGVSQVSQVLFVYSFCPHVSGFCPHVSGFLPTETTFRETLQRGTPLPSCPPKCSCVRSLSRGILPTWTETSRCKSRTRLQRDPPSLTAKQQAQQFGRYVAKSFLRRLPPPVLIPIFGRLRHACTSRVLRHSRARTTQACR